jgi:hypothetical protein
MVNRGPPERPERAQLPGRSRSERTRNGGAVVVTALLDERWPDAERILPAQDVVNTHIGSLCKALSADPTKRLADKLGDP